MASSWRQGPRWGCPRRPLPHRTTCCLPACMGLSPRAWPPVHLLGHWATLGPQHCPWPCPVPTGHWLATSTLPFLAVPSSLSTRSLMPAPHSLGCRTATQSPSLEGPTCLSSSCSCCSWSRMRTRCGPASWAACRSPPKAAPTSRRPSASCAEWPTRPSSPSWTGHAGAWSSRSWRWPTR
uniref:Alternative protein NR5A1 n=1 Tax=Homo sapiens TaxID=9606 RepID=L8ECB8_HUMAN|nr:alternative protein NR5A1 [Homo sapiens]